MSRYYYTPTAWAAGADIDGVCPNPPVQTPLYPPVTIGSEIPTETLDRVMGLLRERGLLYAMASRWGTSGDYAALARVSVKGETEYVLILTAMLRA